MHLRPHRRVQPIGPDQEGPFELHALAVASLDQRLDATTALVVAVTDDRHAGPHRTGAEALDDGAVQQHLQATAVHRILRPVIAGAHPARLV